MASVKLDQYHTVFATFRDMKRQRFLCDLDLKVGDQYISVHRILMAASSSYFAKKFSDDLMMSRHSSFMEIKDVKSWAVWICVEFIYTGDAVITMDVVRGVLHAAILLQLHGLTKLCVAFLEESLTSDSCLKVREIAMEYNILQTAYAVDAFVFRNFNSVIDSSGFQELSSLAVTDFVRKTVNCSQAWNAMLSWTKGDFVEREKFLPELLELIVAKACPFQFLYEAMWKEELTKDFPPKCRLTIVEAMLGVLAVTDINESNCFELLQTTHIYKSQRSEVVVPQIRDFIAGNFGSLSQRDTFKSLDSVDLLKILESPNAECHSAEIKWEACTSWIKFDLYGRKTLLQYIMRRISWTGCAFGYFLEKVLGDILVQKSNVCADLAADLLFRLMTQDDVNNENWHTLLEISQSRGNVRSKGALEKVLIFVAVNFEELSGHSAFGKLRQTEVLKLLQSPAVKSFSEEVQWEGAIKWLKKDLHVRKNDLADVLLCLELSTWPFQVLFSTVFRDIRSLDSSECCLNIVIDAFLKVLKDENITTSNWFLLLTTSRYLETASSRQAIEKIKSFGVKNYDEISKHSEFFKLEEADLLLIIDSPEFAKYNEELRWTPTFFWLLHKQRCVSAYLNVFAKLKLKSFSFQFLFTQVYTQSVVREISELRDMCVAAMLWNMKYEDISVENWYELLNLAKAEKRLQTCEITNKIKRFMAANFAQIQSQPHFEKLEKEELQFILSLPEIDKSSAVEQLNGIAEWMKVDLARKIFFLDFAKCLKLGNFPFDILFDHLINNQLVLRSNYCTALFLSALQSTVSAADISENNWSYLLRIAQAHGEMHYGGIVSHVRKHLAENFLTAWTQDEFTQLNIQDIAHVLQAPELGVREEVKARAVMKWVSADVTNRDVTNADVTNREEYLSNLLEFVKLENLSMSFLRSKIYSDPMVKKSKACQDLIIESLFAKRNYESVVFQA